MVILQVRILNKFIAIVLIIQGEHSCQILASKSRRIWPVSKVGLTPLFLAPFSGVEIGHFKSGVIGVVAVKKHEARAYFNGLHFGIETPINKSGVYPTFFATQNA